MTETILIYIAISGVVFMGSLLWLLDHHLSKLHKLKFKQCLYINKFYKIIKAFHVYESVTKRQRNEYFKSWLKKDIQGSKYKHKKGQGFSVFKDWF